MSTIVKDWSHLSQDGMYRLFCEWLALPPAAAGIRLIPERDLSEQIGIPRKRLRSYLDRLIEEGVVVRRHGSGNYLRRVPKITGPRTWPKETAPFMVFSDDKPDPKLVPMPQQKELHLGVWSGFQRLRSPNQSVLEGIAYEAKLAKHKIHNINVFKDHDKLMSTDELARLIERENVDGHMVSQLIAPYFQKALEKVMGSKWLGESVLYIAPHYAQVMCEPIMRLDMLEAMERAIHILSSNGYERIAVIAGVKEEHIEKAERISYDRAMALAGLSFSSYCIGEINADFGYSAMIELLDGDSVPDAVFIANDKLAQGIAQALNQRGLVPGEDIGLIIGSNRDNIVPEKLGWSRLEFDPFLLGRISLNSLVREIITAHAEAHSLSLLARWYPEATHLRS